MFRLLLPVTLLTALCASADKDAGGSLPDDLKTLQGVWQSTPEAKRQLRILFLDNKVGYLVRDPAGKPDAGPLSFVALSAASHKEEKGKRFFEMEITKDYVKRVEYRFDKGALVLTVDGTAYKMDRLNTRASADPAAKKLVGTWKVTSAEFKGKVGKPSDVGLEAVIFTDNRYVLKAVGGKEVLNSFYRIDAGKSPAVMDWFGMKPDFVIPLIYEQKDDEIRLAHPPLRLVGKGAKRPESFDTTKSETLVIRAKREK